MGLTVAWLMAPPATLNLDAFEEWYLGTHAEVARRLPGLRRYAVSRLLGEPGPPDASKVFRVAQLCWADVTSATEAFNSFEGMATIGDGVAHAGLAYTSWMALTRDRSLPVAAPATFDLVTGGFRSDDGQVVKLLAYGAGASPDVLDAYVREYGGAGGLGEHPLLRQHVVGEPDPQPIRVGLLTMPDGEVRVADWSLEWWFDSVEDADTMMASPAYQRAWAALLAGTSEVFRGLFLSQELFTSVPAQLTT